MRMLAKSTMFTIHVKRYYMDCSNNHRGVLIHIIRNLCKYNDNIILRHLKINIFRFITIFPDVDTNSA